MPPDTEPKDCPPRPKRFPRIIVAVFLLVMAAALLAWWYNRQGLSAWQKYKAELEARGEILDWRAWLPPLPPPDDQNFAATPVLEAVAVRSRIDQAIEARFGALPIQKVLGWGGDAENGQLTDFDAFQAELRQQPGAAATFPPLPRDPAEDVLSALEPMAAELEEIRNAAMRPHSQVKLNFPDPISAEMPNFVILRELAQMFDLQAKADLRLGRTEDAFADVRTICRLGDAGGTAPNLVSGMIQVTIYGLVIESFWEGWVTGRWSDEQLEQFQDLFPRTNLLVVYDRAWRGERARFNYMIETMPGQIAKTLQVGASRLESLLANLLHFGNYAERNQLVYNRLLDEFVLANHDAAEQRVFSRQWTTNSARLNREIQRARFMAPIAASTVPYNLRAGQVMTRNQTFLNLAIVACALERYRRANGEYPQSLEGLVPVFAKSLPHDLVTGQPLKYRRTEDGKFLLYSVGWNETDDGGVRSKDREKGDWVWPVKVKR